MERVYDLEFMIGKGVNDSSSERAKLENIFLVGWPPETDDSPVHFEQTGSSQEISSRKVKFSAE